MTSTAGGTAVKPDLTETGNTTNVFSASLKGTTVSSEHGNAITGGTGLLFANGAKLSFSYADADPSTNVAAKEAWIDAKAPAITIASTGITNGSATSKAGIKK